MVDRETRDLRAAQQRRADREKRMADQSDQPSDEAAHRRRAEKARYLEEKLEDRAQAEQED